MSIGKAGWAKRVGPPDLRLLYPDTQPAFQNRFLPSQVSLPVVSLGLVELGLVARLAFLGVNPSDGIHVAPTLANLDISIHCGDSLVVSLKNVKRLPPRKSLMETASDFPCHLIQKRHGHFVVETSDNFGVDLVAEPHRNDYVGDHGDSLQNHTITSITLLPKFGETSML